MTSVEWARFRRWLFRMGSFQARVFFTYVWIVAVSVCMFGLAGMEDAPDGSLGGSWHAHPWILIAPAGAMTLGLFGFKGLNGAVLALRGAYRAFSARSSLKLKRQALRLAQSETRTAVLEAENARLDRELHAMGVEL